MTAHALNGAVREGAGAVRIIRTDLSAPWDAFVRDAAESTFCHQFGWRNVMTDVLGHEPIYLAAVDAAGVWMGVLPLVRVRSLLGHYIVSMPFLNDGGPLGDAETQEMLVTHAVAEAKQSGAKIVELRSRHMCPGPVQPAGRKITVLLPLPDSVDELWKTTFKAKLRSQIRRPAKEGMTARSGPGELAAFYDVFARNMRDLGTPVLPRAFFSTMLASFGDAVSFTTVYTTEGSPAAAACCLRWRDEVEITWASSIRELNRLSPNMLLYARVIEDAIGRGARVFNFGRCTPDGPTHRFKQQWGGHDVSLPWPTWSRSGDVGTPSPDKPIFRLATAVWSRLPLGVTNRVGPMLSRHLP